MDQPPSTPKEPRGPVSLRIKFRSASLDQFIERYAVDVSRGGIFIRTREPLAVGTQLRFDFQLQDAAPLLAGEGTVVWIRENDPNRAGVTPGMGVRFDKLTPASQPTLERILAEKVRREQEGAPSKTGPAGGIAVRRPSSTFSALDPAAARALAPTASEPPRMGGLSPLAPSAAPRVPQPPTGSGALRTGAAPRAAQPATGSGPLSAKPKTAENQAPQGIPTLEASGTFSRARTTTGVGAQRSVPAPSALFEKPTAEDIDRALSVLTEVEGAAPEAMPEPVDFSARFRRPTEPQPTVPEPPAAPVVVKTTPAAAAMPSDLMKTVRRPTDAQPLILESAPDVGDAPARRSTGTRPLFSGSGVGTSEQRLPTVPVVPVGGPPPEGEAAGQAGQHGEDDEDGQTSAWQNSGPTRVGGTDPDLAALTGSGDSLPKAPPPKPELPAPPALSLDKAAALANPATLDKAPPVKGEAPAIMSPDFAAAAIAAKAQPKAQAKKRSGAPVIILLLLAAGAAGAYYVTQGGTKPATPPEATTAPTEPANAAAPAPAGAAPATNPAGGEAGAGAAPAAEAAKPREAKAPEAKAPEAKAPEAKPSEAPAPPAEAAKSPTAEQKPSSEGKSSGKEGGRKGKRKSGSAASEATPAVADVSPAAGDSAAAPAAEAPKSGTSLRVSTTPSGAEVIIDGNSVGKTPYVSSDLDPSAPHAITIKKDGFEDHERMISGSDWPRAKGGVRTLKVSVKLRSTGGEPAKPPEGGEAPSEPPPGLGTTPTTPKRE